MFDVVMSREAVKLKKTRITLTVRWSYVVPLPARSDGVGPSAQT